MRLHSENSVLVTRNGLPKCEMGHLSFGILTLLTTIYVLYLQFIIMINPSQEILRAHNILAFNSIAYQT